jgi:hypothetical protein
VQNAIQSATLNQVMSQAVSVVPGDVTFPNDPQGQPNRVMVNVFRTSERSNPLSTLIAPFFSMPAADVTATAVAEASPANAATCIKPWAVPDKWLEVIDPPWDPDDTFDVYKKNGKGMLPNPDIYVPVGNTNYTGYNPDPAGPDYGLAIMLKAGSPQQALNASHFFPIALPPDNGGDWYRENIPECWPGILQIGDLVPVEPGNMTGPTMQGVEELMAKDPNAYWDDVNERVVSTMNPSPRIVTIPVFDPMVYEESRQSGRQDIQVANLVNFFLINVQNGGNSIYGRIVPGTGLIRGTGGGPAPIGSFLKAIRLVQ